MSCEPPGLWPSVSKKVLLFMVWTQQWTSSDKDIYCHLVVTDNITNRSWILSIFSRSCPYTLLQVEKNDSLSVPKHIICARTVCSEFHYFPHYTMMATKTLLNSSINSSLGSPLYLLYEFSLHNTDRASPFMDLQTSLRSIKYFAKNKCNTLVSLEMHGMFLNKIVKNYFCNLE